MKHILKDWRFRTEVAAFVLLLYSTSFCVYLSGDDFMYGAFACTGILANVVDYYFTGNGRFWINILDSMLLRFDRYAFAVLLPWLVLVFVLLLAKTVVHIMGDSADRQKEKMLIRTGMVLFACLDVLCLRETVFWITGMMNYLFPAIMFLLAYLLFRKSRAGELLGVEKIGYYLVCFFAASGVEQFALMFIGMMTLHHGYDLLKKRKIPVREWIAYVVSIIGLAMLILAPGNFQRVDEQQMPSFAVNLWSLLYQDTVHDVAVPYLLMLSLIGAWLGWQAKSKVVRWYVQGVPFVIAVVLSTSLASKAIVLAVLIFLWLAQMTVMFAILKEENKTDILFLCFVGGGSQVMLLISAVWGFRCMLSLYLVYMLVIGCLLYHADTKCRLFVLASGILAFFHPAATLGFWVVAFLFRRKDRFTKKLSTIITCCGSAAALLILLIGYGQNTQTHKLNLQSTMAQENQKIVIQELPDDTFSWYFVPISEFHEGYYRILHDVPENVEIVYEVGSASIN